MTRVLVLLSILIHIAGSAIAAPSTPIGWSWGQLRQTVRLEELSVSSNEEGLMFSDGQRTWLLSGFSGQEVSRDGEVFHLNKIPKTAKVSWFQQTFDRPAEGELQSQYGPARREGGDLVWELPGNQLARYDVQSRTFEVRSGIQGAGAKRSSGSAQAGMTAVEQAIFDRTNAERAKHGLPALQPYPALVAAARSHSEEMARMDYFDHQSPTPGRTEVWDRVQQYGYDPRSIGENLYSSEGTPVEQVKADAVRGWMNSPGHRANLLAGKFTQMGIGVSVRGKQVYVTQVFAGN